MNKTDKHQVLNEIFNLLEVAQNLKQEDTDFIIERVQLELNDMK